MLGNLWETSLYPGRGPDGGILVRAMFGGAVDAAIGELDETEMLALATREVARLYGLSSAPVFAHVVRLQRAIPQYEVGHAGRVAAVDRAVAARPGLAVTGFGLRGVAFGDAAADGFRTGEAIGRWLVVRAVSAAARERSPGVGARHVPEETAALADLETAARTPAACRADGPLAACDAGLCAIVLGVTCPAVEAQRLRTLGVYEGARVSIVDCRSGILLDVCGTRLALDDALAASILVRPVARMTAVAAAAAFAGARARRPQRGRSASRSSAIRTAARARCSTRSRDAASPWRTIPASRSSAWKARTIATDRG